MDGRDRTRREPESPHAAARRAAGGGEAGGRAPTHRASGGRWPAVTARDGTPYHRLALSRRSRWWQPLTGTVLILLGLAVTLFALTVFYVLPAWTLGAARSIESFPEFATPLLGEAHLLLVFAMLLPVVRTAAEVAQDRPAGTLVSVAGAVRWRWLAASLVPAVGTVVLMLVASRLVTDAPGDDTARWSEWVGWPHFLLVATLSLLLVPLQAAGEEHLFRGWVLQSVGCWLRSPRLGIALSAVASALVQQPWHLPGILAGLVTGAMLAVLVIRTGGLEAAIAYHAVSNLAAVLFDAAVGGSGIDASAHMASWLELVFTVTQVLVFMRLMRAYLTYPPVAALLQPRARRATYALGPPPRPRAPGWSSPAGR